MKSRPLRLVNYLGSLRVLNLTYRRSVCRCDVMLLLAVVGAGVDRS